MFRRYPYQGWLLAVLLLWLAASGYYYLAVRQAQPERIAHLVGKDLRERMAGWYEIRRDTALTERIFNRQLTQHELNKLLRRPFYINAHENGALIFWNNNLTELNCDTPGIYLAGNGSQSGRSIFFTQCDTVSYEPLRTLSVIVPIAWIYPFENNHLRSHWLASALIPPSAKVSRHPAEGFEPVYADAGKTAFYMQLQPEDMPQIKPDHYIIWIVITTAIAVFFWIHLVARHLSKTRKSYTGLLFITVTIICIRAALYYAGLPFNLGEVELFSPRLYASSTLLPSLGDLLINTLLLAWLCTFIFMHIPYRTFIPGIWSAYLRYPLFILTALCLTACTCYAVHIIRSVVADSMISFEVSDFYAIDGYTVAGLVVIMLTASIAAIVLHILNAQFAGQTDMRRIKYPLIIATGFLYIYLDAPNHIAGQPQYYLLLWLVLFIGMLDIKWLQISRDLLAPKTILWVVFISISTTMLMQYFNHEKERETRKLFAAKLLHQKDPVTEYLFIDIARALSVEPRIKSFIEQPGRKSRKELENRIEVLYLNGHLNKYRSDIYLYNADGQGLYNTPSVPLYEMEERIAQVVPVDESQLYFIENAPDNHYYLARIPIRGDDTMIAGYLFIDMTLKKENNETVYPELLQPGNISSVPQTVRYDYAIYNNQHMVTQYGYYPFPLKIHQSGQDTLNYVFEDKKNISTLWYRADTDRCIVVVHHDYPWLRLTTMFSYLFSVLLLLMFVTIILSIWFSYTAMGKRQVRLGHMTLRRRIHYTMLGIVLASFLVIGIATITFFNNRYQESSRNKLQEITRTIENSIRQHMNSQKAISRPEAFSTAMQQPEFQYLINSLAHQYGIDINIFNTAGVLLTTSRSAIYDKKLLAPLMRADAYQEFGTKNISLLLQHEKIGTLPYLSGYIPFQDKAGITTGYINVPYYASQEELKYQVSNILVALINLYAFILLISSLLAVIITNNLTRSLHMIIGKFKRLNLQQNELIEWPYDDEIGLLVKEYNKMVQKVETHALMLVQNERESAWREMARQVAHEIKNPLTPMKLNIQYLQQALKLNHPNVKDLTTRISGSLIEQIDNLSYIASEFSNFAKMPEARPELLELNETLERAVELYLNKNNVTVTFHSWREPLRVLIDKSQLLRVCTNLIQNAIQAIPEGQAGRIEIMLGRERQNVILSFRDNGNGIPAQVKGKIFKPYFTTKTAGTGLGLAMTRKIIEFWKGNIWFETEEGKGTIFFIRLPLTGPEQEEQKTES